MAVFLSSGGREPQTITFALGGDINLARGVKKSNAEAWGIVFAHLRDVLRADVVLANLESPLTDQPKETTGIDLRAPLKAVQALKPFTHLSVENNHALDGGEVGREQNLRTLRASDLTPLTREPAFLTVQGMKVALLAYLDDGQPLPIAAVRAAKEKTDLVVVMPHWGAEYNVTNPRQREQARLLAQAGATLIVGSGPHVLQGTERIGNTLVLYSLGNLLFDQPYPAAWLGALVRVQVRGESITACAVPTFTRSGRVELALGVNQSKALARLGLPACAGKAG